MAQGTATVSRVTAGNARRRGLIRLVLIGILCLIGIGYISPAYNFYTRTNDIRSASEVNNALQETHDALIDEKERLIAGSYIEEVARKDLGLVKPGEQPFIVKDIEQDATTGAMSGEEAVQAMPSEPEPAPAPAPGNLSAVFPF